MAPIRRGRGLVISAGTGAAAIAFYLPAYLQIASWLTPGRPWVKAIAVYPRIELLKDQFTEAFRLARRLDGVLRAHRLPPLSIGTFFSLTPRSADRPSLRDARWKEVGRGFACPFLLCPQLRRR